jgi:glycosyltransferase involved in cell wall biosynthesis
VKVAIVHYWWLSNRGGEAVVAELAAMYPDADLFVQVCDEVLVRETLGPGFRGRIITSFVARLPFAKSQYPKYLPFMPLALEQWDLTPYDLVISSESGPAKGVVTRPDSLHVCYCHSPMRYLWDMYPQYLRELPWLFRGPYRLFAHWARVWDRATADRVDHFIANSRFVESRLRKAYRRSAEIVPPPVDVSAFDPARPREAFYLCLGELMGYKRTDLAVEAFNASGRPLVIIGEGEQFRALRRKAKPNVRLLGRQPFAVVKDHLERCRALVFPGLEDFGIVPVEAMAAGAPVIAFGRGGVRDTVVDGQTGLYFHEQSAAALGGAVDRIEQGEVRFDAVALHRHALQFDRPRFRERIAGIIGRLAAAG